MSVIPNWLVQQYNYAKAQGWVPYFQEAASKYGFATEDLLGVASRESNMKNIKGDFHDGTYHGFSVMQLDINSHRAWINSGKWQNINEAIMRGAGALAEKRDQIVRASKQKSAIIKFRSGKTAKFTPKPFNDEQLRQMTIAGYNCGMAGYYHFSLGHDIDAGTANKNYSRDALKRSHDFKDLMARDAFGKTANDREIEHADVSGDPPPAEVTKNPFDKIEEKYNAHADLVASPTTKAVAGKFAGRAGSGLLAVWGTTSGKIALVLSVLVILGTCGWLGAKYRHAITDFYSQLKTYLKGKF